MSRILESHANFAPVTICTDFGRCKWTRVLVSAAEDAEAKGNPLPASAVCSLQSLHGLPQCVTLAEAGATAPVSVKSSLCSGSFGAGGDNVRQLVGPGLVSWEIE
jgi:hypothetical protein